MRLLLDRKGSFTFESALIFPSIFISILIMMFFCLYTYQNVLLGHVATVAAERSAYSWDNSHRNPATGQFEMDERDSLYWRLSDDDLVQSIFGWKDSSAVSQLQLPIMHDVKEPLTIRKLAKVGEGLPTGRDGEMKYENRALLRKVTVSLNRLISLAPLERIIDVTQKGKSTSYVVEPVEWIRTIDLARYYGAKFKATGSNRTDQAEASKALKMYGK